MNNPNARNWMMLDAGLLQLAQAVKPTEKTESINLINALDRVIAQDIVAPFPLPSFDNSAMDGYGVRIDDIEIGKPYPIQGRSLAGKPFKESLEANKVIRITTGAAISEGIDTIILQENTTQTEHGIVFNELDSKGSYVRSRGEDIQQGQKIITANTRINAAHLALLASVGCTDIPVYQKTRIGLLSTGDELKTPGEALNFGDIYNSNGPAIEAMLSRLNVEITNYGVLPDNKELFRSAFITADQENDFVLTTGGVSVGEADYTKDILEELGEVAFWKLAIKPGKPFAFGILPNSYFIGLPGNPVSAIVTCHILASQAIRLHQHLGVQPMQKLQATLLSNLHKSAGRMDFQRGIWRVENDEVVVEPTRLSQDSHILSSLAIANCYIALERDRENVQAGEKVTLWLFDELI